MSSAKVRELECNTCGQKRWGVDGAVCSLTLGCTGRLGKDTNDKVRTPDRRDDRLLGGTVDGVRWSQESLFEATG